MNNLEPIHTELAETLRLDVLDHLELFERDDDTVYSVTWQFKDGDENIVHEHYAHVSTLVCEGGSDQRRRSIMNREHLMGEVPGHSPDWELIADHWNYEREDGGFPRLFRDNDEPSLGQVVHSDPDTLALKNLGRLILALKDEPDVVRTILGAWNGTSDEREVERITVSLRNSDGSGAAAYATA